jgi:hypothetical protein
MGIKELAAPFAKQHARRLNKSHRENILKIGVKLKRSHAGFHAGSYFKLHLEEGT